MECSEARLLGIYLKANENITAEIGRRAAAARRGWRQCGRFWKAKVPKRVKRLGGDKHGAGTKTLRSPGSRAAQDVEKPVGRVCSTNMERNQTAESKTCVPLLGPVAGG